MSGNVIDRAGRFLVECGICDYGIAAPCVCSGDDYRPVMLDLVREVERLRRVTQERDHARDDLALARAELASARQELDALRIVRDRLDRQLAEARQKAKEPR